MRLSVPNEDIFKKMYTQAIINELIKREYLVYSTDKDENGDVIAKEELHKDIPEEMYKGHNTSIQIDLDEIMEDNCIDIFEFATDDEIEEEFFNRNIQLDIQDCINEIECEGYIVTDKDEFSKYAHLNNLIDDNVKFRNFLCDVLGVQYIVDNNTLLDELKKHLN